MPAVGESCHYGSMGKWTNWKELKKTATDPERVEQVRRGIDNGRRGVAARLAGPAAHLRTVGQEFKAGLSTPETPEPPAPSTDGDPEGTKSD